MTSIHDQRTDKDFTERACFKETFPGICLQKPRKKGWHSLSRKGDQQQRNCKICKIC